MDLKEGDIQYQRHCLLVSGFCSVSSLIHVIRLFSVYKKAQTLTLTLENNELFELLLWSPVI